MIHLNIDDMNNILQNYLCESSDRQDDTNKMTAGQIFWRNDISIPAVIHQRNSNVSNTRDFTVSKFY